MTGTLEGLTVVDLSWGRPGRCATGLLADHGATGRAGRAAGRRPLPRMVARAAYDRGKRSMILDLHTSEGRDALDRLLADRRRARRELAARGRRQARPRLRRGARPSPPPGVLLDHRLTASTARAATCPATSRWSRPASASMALARAGRRAGLPGRAHRRASGPAMLAVIGIMAALGRAGGHRRRAAGRHVRCTTGRCRSSTCSGRVSRTCPTTPSGRGRRPPRRFMMAQHALRRRRVPRRAHGRRRLLQPVDGRARALRPCASAAGQPGEGGAAERRGVPDRHDRGAAAVRQPAAGVLVGRAARPRRVRHPRAATGRGVGRAADPPQRRRRPLDDPELGPLAQVGVAAKMARPGAVRGPAPVPGADTDAILGELR